MVYAYSSKLLSSIAIFLVKDFAFDQSINVRTIWPVLDNRNTQAAPSAAAANLFAFSLRDLVGFISRQMPRGEVKPIVSDHKPPFPPVLVLLEKAFFVLTSRGAISITWLSSAVAVLVNPTWTVSLQGLDCRV